MIESTILNGPTCESCNGKTILYCYPDKYSGIWECDDVFCGASGNHKHTPVEENIEINFVTSEGDLDSYCATITKCAECDIEIN